MLLRLIASAILTTAIAAQDTAASKLLEQAGSHYRALRSADAVKLYRQYLAQYPERPDVRVYLGAALLNLNELEGGLREARRAIELDQRFAKAYTLAGRIYAQREEWQVAQEFFRKAVGLDPADQDSWYFMGRASFEATQFTDAIEAFRKAIALGEHSRIFENLGLAHEALGKHAEAETAYRSAIKIAAGAYRPYVAYGRFLLTQARFEESLSTLKKAASMAPGSSDVQFELGRVLYHMGRLEEAANVIVTSDQSGNCRLLNLRSLILMRLGRTRDAERDIAALAGCSGRGQ